MNDLYPHSEFSTDNFLDQGLILTQPKNGFRAGSDAVFLARFMNFPAKSHILDVGCGLGGAGLCAAYKNVGIQVTGLEKQEFYSDLAHYNARQNNLDGRFQCQQGDVADIQTIFPPDYFTHIITNPPFYEAGTGRKPKDQGKIMAHQGDNISLEIWIRKSLSVLKNAGTMIMIIRTERLQDIMNALQNRAGDIQILPLISRAGGDAKRMILSCKKASKTGTKILSPLILHQENSRDYTEKAQAVLSGERVLIL